MTDKDKKDPFEALTEEQRARLANLTSEVRYDKLTVSFLIEARQDGVKRAAFYSASISRKENSWTLADAKLARSLLCKHVVAATYDDAVRRRMMAPGQAREELPPIIAAYDALILKNLTNGSE